MILLVLIAAGAGVFWHRSSHPAPQPEPPQPELRSVQAPDGDPRYSHLDLRCVGDVMTHMPQVNAALQDDGSYDFADNYKYVRRYLEEATLAVVNVETTMPGDGHYSGYPVFDAPDVLAQNLKTVGFDVAATSNNHMLDTGLKGALRTAQLLAENGLAVVGTRQTAEDARSIVVQASPEGVMIGVVAYTYETPLVNGRRTLNGSYMPSGAPDHINSFRTSNGVVIDEDKEAIASEIAWCRAHGAELVICYFHWGNEYQRKPAQQQTDLARFAAENGADVIFASHPHILQGIEEFVFENEERPAPHPGFEGLTGVPQRKVPVFYSMGNFVSNQRSETLASTYGADTARRTEEGMIACVDLDWSAATGEILGQKTSCIPTWVEKYVRNGKTVYYIIPLVQDWESNTELLASGHLDRARKALAEAEEIVGGEYIRYRH